MAEARRSRNGPPAALIVLFLFLDELRGQPPWAKGLAGLAVLLLYYAAFWAADSAAAWLIAHRRAS